MHYRVLKYRFNLISWSQKYLDGTRYNLPSSHGHYCFCSMLRIMLHSELTVQARSHLFSFSILMSLPQSSEGASLDPYSFV